MPKYEILKFYEQSLRQIEDVIGVSSTSNFKINKLCFKFVPNYIGTYSSNNIPRMKNNECCITNTDDDKSNGIHWCALIKYDSYFYFYDSFARDYKILSPFWKTKKWINANTYDIDQSIKEKNCGARCIAWLFTFYKFMYSLRQ